VLVLGLAFKPGTDDMRESIAVPLIRDLAGRGAEVRAHDPRVAPSAARALLDSSAVEVVAEDSFRDAFDTAAAVVLVTAWPCYLEMLPALLAARSAPLLFADTRGILRETKRAPCVTYLGIGALRV
jgi:UDP-glucose 6-dehydrogenase